LAPLFVWLEILFAFGYRPSLKKSIDDEVKADKAARQTHPGKIANAKKKE
jgi:2-hydroxy fatty acid dioxygenase